MPAPDRLETVVVLSAYRGDGLSTHALGSIDTVTEVQDVEVRTGGGPYYIAIRNHGSLIWRFTGNVDAISRVVVLGSELGRGRTGVVGVASERVTFVVSEDLTGTVGRTTCGRASKACVADEYFVGPNLPDVVHSFGRTKFNQRERWQARAIQVDRRIPTYIPMDQADAIAERAKLGKPPWPQYRSGVVAINPSTVVSEDVLVEYPLLPRDAGIGQLISAGTLHPKGSPRYREVYDRWDAALSQRFGNPLDQGFRFGLEVDYVVTGNMTLPLGLENVRFLVSAEVNAFGGTLDYRSCVFFEDRRSDHLGCVNRPKPEVTWRYVEAPYRDAHLIAAIDKVVNSNAWPQRHPSACRLPVDATEAQVIGLSAAAAIEEPALGRTPIAMETRGCSSTLCPNGVAEVQIEAKGRFVLVLNGGASIRWKIKPNPEANVIAVITTGPSQQLVSGLPGDTPVHDLTAIGDRNLCLTITERDLHQVYNDGGPRAAMFDDLVRGFLGRGLDRYMGKPHSREIHDSRDALRNKDLSTFNIR
jgi:hypothetical protein